AATPALASGVGRVADLKRRLTMILRGTTPSGLGRPATLLMLALAALVLPLVPGLARAQDEAQPKRTTVRGKAVELELALRGAARQQGDLAKLEAEIAKLAAELAKKKLALDAARKAKDAVAKFKKGGVSVRIEINGLSAEQAKDLAKVLEKALPGKDKKILITLGGERTGTRLWTVPATRAVPGVPAPPKPGTRAIPAVPPAGGFKFTFPNKAGDSV